MHLYEYHAKVVRVIDGDTLDLDVSLGFYVTQKVRVRLAGVNTPEMHDTDATKRAAAQAAKSFVEGLVLNKDVELKTQKTEKYGRWLATITIPGEPEKDLAMELLAAGHAVKYMA